MSRDMASPPKRDCPRAKHPPHVSGDQVALRTWHRPPRGTSFRHRIDDDFIQSPSRSTASRRAAARPDGHRRVSYNFV